MNKPERSHGLTAASLLHTRRMVVLLLISCFIFSRWPDIWDAYSRSLHIGFILYRVGSGIVEMVVGTTRKPSSLEVNFVTLFIFCKTNTFLWAGRKPKPLGKSYSYTHCQQSPTNQNKKSNGTGKVQNDAPHPPSQNLSVCHCLSLAVLLPPYCDVAPSFSLTLSVCLLAVLRTSPIGLSSSWKKRKVSCPDPRCAELALRTDSHGPSTSPTGR